MDASAESCLKLQAQMEADRGTWEGHWREVAELVRPNQNFFQMMQRPQGDKRNQRIFDDTAPLALPKFAAAVISMAFPATQRYHKLTCMDDKLSRVPAVKKWFEATNEVLFKVRYGPHANFQSQSAEMVLDVGAFGTGVMFIDDAVGLGIRYKSFPLAESYVTEDEHGVINRLHRKFQYTAEQAMSMFEPSRLSDGLKAAAQTNPQTKFWFLHCVGPNSQYDPGQRLNPVRGKRFESLYVEMGARRCVDEGGYRTFPFAVARYETSPREVYGRSPAMKVLPTIKTLNEMKKTVLRAGQMQVSPPLMLTDDASLSAFDMRSNALNHGYLDSQGRALAMPLQTNGRVELGLDLMDAERQAINDAFLVTLFRILVDQPQITATEAMLRAQEKGQLLAPTMGRMQSEVLGVCVERELDILSMNGSLPEMPPELMEAGGAYKVEYESPLNTAQRASKGVAILQAFNALGPMAQIDPTVMDIIDTHDAARELLASNGFPESATRSVEEASALADQRAQQAQIQQLLAAAPVAAGAAKDLAQAQALAGSAPGQQAPNLGLTAA